MLLLSTEDGTVDVLLLSAEDGTSVDVLLLSTGDGTVDVLLLSTEYGTVDVLLLSTEDGTVDVMLLYTEDGTVVVVLLSTEDRTVDVLLLSTEINECEVVDSESIYSGSVLVRSIHLGPETPPLYHRQRETTSISSGRLVSRNSISSWVPFCGLALCVCVYLVSKVINNLCKLI